MKYNMITKNKIKGVTLIELLVAVAIFVIIVTAAVGLYVSIIKSQQRTMAMQDIQQDARYAMEAMAREFRMGRIYYSIYGGGVQDIEDKLAIIDKDRELIVFRLGDGEFCDHDTLCVRKGYGSSYKPITSSGVEITNLRFYLHPKEDSEEYHQRVTIVMTAETTKGSKEKQARIDLQTTVSSRVYKP